MSEDQDEVAQAIARNLAQGRPWGEILLGEGQSIVYLEGHDFIRQDPDGTRIVMRRGEDVTDQQ